MLPVLEVGSRTMVVPVYSAVILLGWDSGDRGAPRTLERGVAYLGRRTIASPHEQRLHCSP